MRTKDGFILRRLGEQYVVVALGQASEEFHGMIRLNASGAYLWEKLSTDSLTEEQLVDAVLDRYETDRDTAKKDVEMFLEKIKHAGLLD